MSPLYPDPTRGLVNQYGSTWETKILAENTIDIQGNAFGTQSHPLYDGIYSDIKPLRVPLGGFQRVILKYHIWYKSDNDNEFKIRLSNELDSNYGTGVATEIDTALIVVNDNKTDGASAESTGIEAAVGTPGGGSDHGATNGMGDIIAANAGSSDYPIYLMVHSTCVATSGTDNFIRFSPRIITGADAGTKVYRGSYVEYKYF